MKLVTLMLISVLATPFAFADSVRQKYNAVRKKTFLTTEEIRLLYGSVQQNPVARLDKVPAYDPDGLVGFCFGRSMAAHLEARRMRLDEASIKKLFIVGDLRKEFSQRTEWRFHVTTLVKGPDDAWIAIDPIMNRAMTMASWIETTRYMWDRWYRHDRRYQQPQSYIYLTPADAVLPDVRDFKRPDQESGENLIDISFSPAGRKGFSRLDSLGDRAYEMNKTATDSYYLGVNEPVKEDRFDFEKMEYTNGRIISYNKYFHDLMAYYQPSTVEVRALALESSVVTKPVREVDAKSAPISFNFEKIFDQK